MPTQKISIPPYLIDDACEPAEVFAALVDMLGGTNAAARRLQISRSFMSQLKNGHSRVSPQMAARISAMFEDLPPSRLLFPVSQDE